jgi:hypothetical protein
MIITAVRAMGHTHSVASPVRVLQWDATTGALRAWSDSSGALSAKVHQLVDAENAVTMNRYLDEIFGRELSPVTALTERGGRRDHGLLGQAALPCHIRPIQ